MHSLWNMPRCVSKKQLVAMMEIVAPDAELIWQRPNTDYPVALMVWKNKTYIIANTGDWEEYDGPCPYDTNGDGDCANRYCPFCGEPFPAY